MDENVMGFSESRATQAESQQDSDPEKSKTSWAIEITRPWRFLRRSWNSGKLNGRKLAFVLFPFLLIAAICCLVLLLTGVAGERTQAQQSWFVLKFLLLSAALLFLLWLFLRPRTSYAFHLVMGTVAIGVIILAVIGFSPYVADRTPWFTQIYWGLLLLAGENMEIWDGRSETLIIQIAQYGGAIVLFGTVLRVIASFGSSSLTRMYARWSRNVILLTGLNTDSLRILKALCQKPEGARVLVLEPDSEHPLIMQTERMGARVAIGAISNRPSDMRWLEGVAKTRLGGRKVALRRVYILGDDEQANVAACETVRQALASLGSDYRCDYLPPTRIIVRIDRFRQARHYAASQISRTKAQPGPDVFVSTIGVNQVTAQALVQRIAEHDDPQEVILVGDSNLADAFLEEWTYQKAAARLLLDAAEQAAVRNSEKDHEPNRVLEDMIKLQQRKTQLPEVRQQRTAPTLKRSSCGLGSGERVSVVIALDRDEFRLREIEKGLETRPEPFVTLYVPDPQTTGIGTLSMLGSLRFYGKSLGGLDRDGGQADPTHVQKPGSQTTEDPMVGVPQDSWFRAAKLISDGYGTSLGPNTWEEQTSEDKESNFRALWLTLKQLVTHGYTWTTSAPSTTGTNLPEQVMQDMIIHEHESWLEFKRHYGWVGVSGTTNDRFLESHFAHSWKDLKSNEELSEIKSKAEDRTRRSLVYNLQALAALGFYPSKEEE